MDDKVLGEKTNCSFRWGARQQIGDEGLYQPNSRINLVIVAIIVALSGQSYEHFTIVIYKSRVVCFSTHYIKVIFQIQIFSLNLFLDFSDSSWCCVMTTESTWFRTEKFWVQNPLYIFHILKKTICVHTIDD